MYRKIVLFFLLISFVFILGCQKNTEKAEQTVIKALKAMKNYDLKKAKKYIEIGKEVIYPEKHRFIVEETAFYNLPFDFGPVVGLIPKNSVVEIEAVCQMNNERWLFIYFPCSNDFALFGSYGWLRETETQPYTENERELVEYPLYLEKGTHYYESFADIDQAKGNALSSRLTVVIIEEKGDYVEVTGPGTFYGWVKKEAIIYPEVD